jgi:hypothetical protein
MYQEGELMNTGYLVQGLKSNSLIAGKTTAFRINMAAPWPATSIAEIEASIARPDGSLTSLNWSQGNFVIVDANSPTEGIVLLIPGFKIPYYGVYYINAQLLSADREIVGVCVLEGIELLPTKDLRMMVSRIWSNTGPDAKAGEVEAANDAMRRLAALYPIRDGISTLNGDQTAGLRFNFDNNPVGPPQQDSNLGPAWDPFNNVAPGTDSLDSALVYRFPDEGEGSGAITHGRYGGWLPNSGIVWHASLGQPFCHETGHNFGCESPESPHFDPGGQAAHSKDLTIIASDAEQGFDIELNQPFPKPVYDIMFPTGPSPGRPLDTISMNSWDWEYLRKQFLKSNATGPHGSDITFQSLGGHDLSPGPSAIRNQDGRLEVFVLGGDKALYHIWESAPGGNWSDWATLAGHDLRGPVITAANADGALQVFVAGQDGNIYSVMQKNPHGGWGDWFFIGGNNVKGYSVSRNTDGRMELVAVFGDGILYDCWQLSPGGQWSGWASLGGHDLNGPVSLAANADGRLEAFVIGGDGFLYHRWQTAPNGSNGWGDWANLISPDFVKANDVKVALAGDGRLFAFLMTQNKSISYLSQVVPNGGWGAVIDLYGHDLDWPCGVGRTDSGRLELAVVGGNGQIYSRWQVDPFKPDFWVNWTSLGGVAIQPGVELASNSAGQLEIFVIGGDGALYRGLRPSS